MRNFSRRARCWLDFSFDREEMETLHYCVIRIKLHIWNEWVKYSFLNMIGTVMDNSRIVGGALEPRDAYGRNITRLQGCHQAELYHRAEDVI